MGGPSRWGGSDSIAAGFCWCLSAVACSGVCKGGSTGKGGVDFAGLVECSYQRGQFQVDVVYLVFEAVDPVVHLVFKGCDPVVGVIDSVVGVADPGVGGGQDETEHDDYDSTENGRHGFSVNLAHMADLTPESAATIVAASVARVVVPVSALTGIVAVSTPAGVVVAAWAWSWQLLRRLVGCRVLWACRFRLRWRWWKVVESQGLLRVRLQQLAGDQANGACNTGSRIIT